MTTKPMRTGWARVYARGQIGLICATRAEARSIRVDAIYGPSRVRRVKVVLAE